MNKLYPSREVLEQSSIKVAKAVPVGARTLLCRILGRFKMFVDAEDLSLAPHLALDGFWESWATLFCGMVVREGDVCLDVGANQGYYSLLFQLLAGPQGRVFAWEPLPGYARLIRRSACINGGAPIHVFEKAAWSRTGAKLGLVITGDQKGGSWIGEAQVGQDSWAADEQVKSMAIDDLALERVDFVKMDIEGSEPDVLEGMVETLRRCEGVKVLTEYDPNRPRHHAMPQFMAELGFDAFVLEDDGHVRPLDKGGPPRQLGHLFFSRKKS